MNYYVIKKYVFDENSINHILNDIEEEAYNCCSITDILHDMDIDDLEYYCSNVDTDVDYY